MSTYIVLASFTDQGIRSIKETTKRADAVKELTKTLELKLPSYIHQAVPLVSSHFAMHARLGFFTLRCG